MAISMRTVCQHSRPFAIQGLVFVFVLGLCTALIATAAPDLNQSVTAKPPLVAQSSARLPNTNTSTKSSPPLKISSKPAWQELTPAQQLSLKPLAANWSNLGEAHKRKWIALAANYSMLAPTEQAKLHAHMTEWASLSQQQRTQARYNFLQSKQLSPTQKTATWEAYQALSPEERQKLARSAAPKSAGAAAAVKPVAPQKLAVVPDTRRTAKPASKIAASNPTVNRNTLLPHPQPGAESAAAQKNSTVPQ